MDSAQQRQQQAYAADQAALQSQAQIEQMQAQMNALQAQQAQSAMMPQSAAPAAGLAAGGSALTDQLQQLAQLRQSGVLSDEEFQAAKAKLLGG
jgi:hypothetical protein